MNRQDHLLAPGARVLVRDAEWLIRRVDRTSTGERALSVVGISELVRDKEAIFLTEVEKSIEVLNPADTKLTPDTSSAYRASLLYMESLLRQIPPTDVNLYMGHRAAMDFVPYQLELAIQALQQPRQRILIADAVGLGKTLEAGILLSELIRRGRGKRILVIAVKSMLTQFQKELWSRFTIPLTRLDSVGIQRLRSRIPTNHNPFYYYDKSIISIDTLKQDAEYRTYLENAYWDIIVIDEAHNVAERGAGASLRSRLAKLVARRSDTLIMLSATPHDGKARSFASLMNMLDPTAIANPEDYGPEDIQPGLFMHHFCQAHRPQTKGGTSAISLQTNVFPPGIAQV
jgi:SNF2 family DNA or RNA helicase